MRDPLGLTPQQRRAAEEHFVARYEAQLMQTMALPPDRRSGPRRYDPIWPLAGGRIRCTEATDGIFVEDVRIDRAYPDTVVRIVFRFFLRPECLYAVEKQLWTLEHLLEPEPWFNAAFDVNLGEWLARDFNYKTLECSRDEPITAGRAGSWLETLPRIALGEIDLGPEARELAIRAMQAFGIEPIGPRTV